MKYGLGKIMTVIAVLILGIASASLAESRGTPELHQVTLKLPPSALTTPYSIMIASKSSTDPANQKTSPFVSVVLKNTSKYQSAFYYAGPTSDLRWNIEYHPSNNLNGQWLHIAPVVKPSPPRGIVEGFQERFSNVEIDLAPGQTFTQNFVLTNYALNLDGDYRMSLSMELPDCTLQDAKTDVFGAALTKGCTITTIYSNTIIVRRTATRFVPINAVKSK